MLLPFYPADLATAGGLDHEEYQGSSLTAPAPLPLTSERFAKLERKKWQARDIAAHYQPDIEQAYHRYIYISLSYLLQSTGFTRLF